jgi:hypothetical protein
METALLSSEGFDRRNFGSNRVTYEKYWERKQAHSLHSSSARISEEMNCLILLSKEGGAYMIPFTNLKG